jgi:large subunit ribosomal protein L25
MSEQISVQKRTALSADEIRAQGLVPGVVYGPEMAPISFSVDYNTFEALYHNAGESSLIDLSVDGGEATKVLIQEIQHDPVKGSITHVDFLQIKMGEEMEVDISLNFVGESLAVKAMGGTLVEGVDHVTVKCLPKDLVNHIDIDLSTLATFEDTISTGSLVLPTGLILVSGIDVMIATVKAPMTEEQLKAMEEYDTGSVEDVEVAGEKKEEGETPAEGEQPKEGEKPAQGGSAKGGKE